ncbi:BIG1-domain-containing protein [Sarocladium strictum]
MRSSLLAGAYAFAGLSAAFSDSSPWIVASTESYAASLLSSSWTSLQSIANASDVSSITTKSDNSHIQTIDTALKSLKDFLSTCPTKNYAVVAQPELHYADLAVEGGSLMKELMKVVDNAASKGKFIVPEVVGGPLDGAQIATFIEEACQQKNKEAQVTQLALPSLPSSGEARSLALASNDDEAASNVLSKLSDSSSTLIFYGTRAPAGERTIYEPEFEEAVMMDLKRNVQGHPSRRADNETEWNKLPLFEKYQFFTPAIFMGLLAVILIGSILTVGLKALNSLEVSYGAFEKDMGPAAQKKQQ